MSPRRWSPWIASVAMLAGSIWFVARPSAREVEHRRSDPCVGTLSFSGTGGARSPERAMTVSGYDATRLLRRDAAPRTVDFVEIDAFGDETATYRVIRGIDGWLVAEVRRVQRCDGGPVSIPDLRLGPRRGSPPGLRSER